MSAEPFKRPPTREEVRDAIASKLYWARIHRSRRDQKDLSTDAVRKVYGPTVRALRDAQARIAELEAELAALRAERDAEAHDRAEGERAAALERAFERGADMR